MVDDELIQPNTDVGTDIGADTSRDSVSRETETPEQPPKLSIRESIDAARKEVAEKQEQEPEKPAPQKSARKAAAAPGQKAGEPSSRPAAATQNVVPPSWSKEEQALWPTLSGAVQKAILRTEENARKGVETLKTQHQELDSAIRPYDETIKRFGFTRSQAVDQLFKWQMALAGPQKIEAFRQLMQSHGVDPSTVAGAPSQAAPGGAQGSGISPELHTVLSGIVNKLGQYDQERDAQTRAAAEHTVMTWAKDKPHFERVRGLMSQLISSGAVPNLQSGHPDLDGAYERAIYADPEVRAQVLAEEHVKKAADNKAAIDRARKAGSSMRVGSPTGGVVNGATRQAQRNESVRDSIKRAVEEWRQ